jgi:hypothetical protein
MTTYAMRVKRFDETGAMLEKMLVIVPDVKAAGIALDWQKGWIVRTLDTEARRYSEVRDIALEWCASAPGGWWLADNEVLRLED